MKIGIGKIGKSVLFDSTRWGAVGGDNEAPIIFEHLIRNNPQHQFVLVCPSDYDRLPFNRRQEINQHDNLINPWDTFAEWKKQGNWSRNHPASDRQEFMEQVLIKNPEWKVDTGVFMMGMSATSNIHGWSKLMSDHTVLAKPLDMQRRYAGPPIWYLNHYNDIPWVMLLNDPRLYPGKMRDLWNPPQKIFSQYDEVVEHINYKSYEDGTRESHTINSTYEAIETIFLIGKKRGEMLEEVPNSLEAFFGEEKSADEKDIQFMIVCNEGKPSRYPDLKKYILDHVQDVDIYGQWNPNTIGDDKRFKGPKKFNDLMQMLPRVKYTFCIPIKKGWSTAKFWEMAHYGIIPFLHPTYDEQDNLKVPDFIRVKDSEDLFNKIKFLEEHPKAYDELRGLLNDILKDEYYNGSYLNDKIINEMESLHTQETVV